MKKIGILVLSLTLLVVAANAQNKTANSLTYKAAAGIKVSNGAGITLKTFLDNRSAVEAIGFFYRRGARVAALYEYYGDFGTQSNLKWYAGAGAHLGLYKQKTTVVGIDGIIGLDYKFKILPLNLSLDWNPSIELRKGYGFDGELAGLGIRYTF